MNSPLPAATLRTYQGSCHCGACRFETDLALDHVRSCDCSVCRRRGALMHRVPDSALRLHTPLDALRVYTWGTGTARDYFCPHCGILPFRRPRALTEAEAAQGMTPFNGWAINVRCLEGVDLDALTVQRIAGAALPLP